MELKSQGVSLSVGCLYRGGSSSARYVHHLSFLTDSLKDFVLFAIEQRPDYIALSFVSKPQDITDVRSILAEKGWIFLLR